MTEDSFSSIKKMRDDFSVSIRKEKKEEIFQSFRSKLRYNLLEEQRNRMLQILDTPQKREQWIFMKARDLSGLPDYNWRYVINELFQSILCFKGKGCFKLWISSSIIKNLCLLFEEQYIPLGLASQAAKLLGNIICLQEEQEQQTNSYIAEEILKQEILRNLILLSENTTTPHHQISNYMTLIANLAVNEPGVVIKYGGFTTFVEWSLRMLKQKKINRAYLDQIYGFFHLFTYHYAKIPTNYNFAHQLLNVMNQFCQIDQTVSLITKMLNIIRRVLLCKKEALYAAFVNSRELRKKVLQLTVHDNQKIRQISWAIFSAVTSGNMSLDFLTNDNDFINRMICAYEMQPKDNRNFEKITSNILGCVSNLICENDQMRQVMLYSPIINIIIDSTHIDRSTNLRKDAFYCLNSTVYTKNYKLFNRIVFELPIIEKLVTGLSSMLVKDKATVKDIILALYEIITVDLNVFRNNGNSVLEILESKYMFSQVLQEVMEKYHADSAIAMRINCIFDLYSC